MRKTSAKVVPWIALVLVMIAPAAFVSALTLALREDTADLLERPSAVWVDVNRMSGADGVEVVLTVEWGPGDQIVAPNWSGIVTESATTAGTLHSGERVLAVDGRWRIAAHTPSPFYRPLSMGDRGPDVAALNAFLSAIGYPSAEGDFFSWATSEAVLKMEAGLGATNDRDFDPADVVWLPSETFEVSKPLFEVGRPVPGFGEPILEGPPLPVSAKVPAGEQVAVPSDQGELLVEVLDQQLTFSGLPEAPIANLEEFGALLTPGTPQIAVSIRSKASMVAWSVPVAAAVEGRRGTCISIRTGDEEISSPQVRILGGEIGRTYVYSGSLPDRFEVLANPQESICD